MKSKETKRFSRYAFVNTNSEFLIMESKSKIAFTKNLSSATLIEHCIQEIKNKEVRKLIGAGELRKVMVFVSVIEEREVF